MGRVWDSVELEELFPELEAKLIQINLRGELDERLKTLGMGDLVNPEPLYVSNKFGKILVLGGENIGADKLKITAKRLGIEGNRLEIVDYEGAKTYPYTSLQYSSKYCAVIIGAVPHMTSRTADSSSVIAEMEKHPDIYPRLKVLRSNGVPKITKTNFSVALRELIEDGTIEIDRQIA